VTGDLGLPVFVDWLTHEDASKRGSENETYVYDDQRPQACDDQPVRGAQLQ
jgi:hypothetical protein